MNTKTLILKMGLLFVFIAFCQKGVCSGPVSSGDTSEITVLVLLSTHDAGYWASEVIDNHSELSQAGVKVVYASPEGKIGIPTGTWLLDESQARTYQTIAKQLTAPIPLDGINVNDFNAIFIPGGSAPMYELYNHPAVNKVVAAFYENDKPVAAVCHGPAALAGVRLSNGALLIENKRVTGVSNAEEDEESKENFPFLLEDYLTELGANYSAKGEGESWVVRDGLLLTGQNPESTIDLSKQLVQMINHK